MRTTMQERIQNYNSHNILNLERVVDHEPGIDVECSRLRQCAGHMQMSMRNGITPKVKLTLILTLTLTDTEGAVLTLMLGYRSLYITWQQHHNCRIVCELSLRYSSAYYPKVPLSLFLTYSRLQLNARRLSARSV